MSDDDTPIIVSALRAEAERQSRAAGALSEQVMAERRISGRDIRSSAVKIVEVLGTGQALNRVADGLESGTLLLVPAEGWLEEAVAATPPSSDPPPGDPDGTLTPPADPPEGDGDGGPEGPVTDAQVVDILSKLSREETPHAGT